MAILFITLILLIFSIMGILFKEMLSSPPRYEPMEFEEEVKWLMEFGLTKEEAEDIANL